MLIKRGKCPWHSIYFLGVIALLLLTVTGSRAEEKPSIELKISAAKESIRLKDGKQLVELLPVEKTRRGDVLVYTINYRNSGRSDARNVAVIDPVPEGTTYIPESAAGKNTRISFSINGGATYMEPPLYFKTRDASGKETSQVAPPEMYTHIKWLVQVPLKPGETGKTSFRVKVK